MASEVTVDLEDLRFLLKKAVEIFDVPSTDRRDPILDVIVRLTNKVCIVTMRNGLEEREKLPKGYSIHSTKNPYHYKPGTYFWIRCGGKPIFDYFPDKEQAIITVWDHYLNRIKYI